MCDLPRKLALAEWGELSLFKEESEHNNGMPCYLPVAQC